MSYAGYIVYNVNTYTVYTTCIHVIYHTPSYKLQARAYDRFLRQIVRIYIYTFTLVLAPPIYEPHSCVILLLHTYMCVLKISTQIVIRLPRGCAAGRHTTTCIYIYISMRYAKYRVRIHNIYYYK